MAGLLGSGMYEEYLKVWLHTGTVRNGADVRLVLVPPGGLYRALPPTLGGSTYESAIRSFS
jgi:hypothetical protein